jgi:deoxyribodipyrimidine photo-lyase
LKEIMEETKAEALYFNERYEPVLRQMDISIRKEVEGMGIRVESFHSNLLFPPKSIKNKSGQPYKVFTPFWKQVHKTDVPFPIAAPSKMASYIDTCSSLSIEELHLLPVNRWYTKLSTYWVPGEKAAIAQMKRFLEEGLIGYIHNRDIPSLQGGVSRLSPHIAWGEISPRWIWHYTLEHAPLQSGATDDLYVFLRQLAWREYGYDQMVNFPKLVHSPIRDEFLSFPWQPVEADFTAWKQGKTGYPFIDAGMRELWETGWMHNRVRMGAASFLVKHLLIPWQEGAKWFEDTLVDADIANNSMGWQWVTGSGFDASPYFRIFNPITQGQKFDPAGAYIRRWVPELANLPEPYLHQPWTAPKEVLQKANIKLGITYPHPIVDHSKARMRALEAYKKIK